MDLHKYISKADAEITALIEKESMTMTSVGQQNLHNILENRKDIMKWAEDMSAVHSGHIGTPMNNTTSYFGG